MERTCLIPFSIPSPKQEQNEISAIFLMIQYFRSYTEHRSKNKAKAGMLH